MLSKSLGIGKKVLSHLQVYEESLLRRASSAVPAAAAEAQAPIGVEALRQRLEAGTECP